MELYTGTYILAIISDVFFGKGGGSRNSHEMRLSGVLGIGLLISPSLRYTANLGIWWGSIPMYASMFCVTLAGDSTSFQCGDS